MKSIKYFTAQITICHKIKMMPTNVHSRFVKCRKMFMSVVICFQFEESYNAILTAFELFDHLSDGYISRVDFRRVLQEFGFNISISDLDHFLSR